MLGIRNVSSSNFQD
jgi:agmatinase